MGKWKKYSHVVHAAPALPSFLCMTTLRAVAAVRSGKVPGPLRVTAREVRFGEESSRGYPEPRYHQKSDGSLPHHDHCIVLFLDSCETKEDDSLVMIAALGRSEMIYDSEMDIDMTRYGAGSWDKSICWFSYWGASDRKGDDRFYKDLLFSSRRIYTIQDRRAMEHLVSNLGLLELEGRSSFLSYKCQYNGLLHAVYLTTCSTFYVMNPLKKRKS